MSASTVILDDVSVKGQENVWALWWEKAVQTGHFRWAFLPSTIGPEDATSTAGSAPPNCITPAFSTRHLASANSGLDSVKPYGQISVLDGPVSIEGRLVGRCEVIRRLGSCVESQQGRVARDVAMIMFAMGNRELAFRLASAFGGERYTFDQRFDIAQLLTFNCYRARLALLRGRWERLSPRFRSARQRHI